MADIIDMANDKADALLDALLTEARYQSTLMVQACGVCLNCGEPLEGEARFCSPECRDDYQRREK